MAIGKIRDDAPAKVSEHEGDVAIWAAADDGDDCGVLLGVPGAVTTAVRILATVADIRGRDNLPVLQVGDVSLDVGELDGDETVIRMVFEVEGAPLAATVDLTQFAEIAAAFARASRDIDRGQVRRTGV